MVYSSMCVQEFCRIYRQFFPFGDPEQLASLVFRGFGVGSGEDGVVGFPQFITALSTATRGSLEERITSERQSAHDCLYTNCDFNPAFDTSKTFCVSFTSLPTVSVVLFRLYDGDGDGNVSREDVEGVIEAMYKMVGPLLAQEGGEERGEGEGEAEELSVTVTARVKEIFKTLDQVAIINTANPSK